MYCCVIHIPFRGGTVFFSLKNVLPCNSIMKRENKILTAFRLKPTLKKRLVRFAKRKKVTSTDVLEALIDRYCVGAKEEKL